MENTMIYVKDNVERIVVNKEAAKKLEAKGFRPAKAAEPVEPSVTKTVDQESVADPKATADNPVDDPVPVYEPKRRRRKPKAETSV